MSIIFVILYWLTVIRITHKLFILFHFILVREDVLIKSIWIKKRKTPLTIPCHAPGVMPLPHCGKAEFSEGEFFVGRLLLVRVVYKAEFSGYRCIGSKRKSEAGTKICPYLAHWCIYNKFSLHATPLTVSQLQFQTLPWHQQSLRTRRWALSC